MSVYPDSASALAPPLRNECVSTLLIGIPLVSGYCKIFAATLRPALTSPAHTYLSPALSYTLHKNVLPLALCCRRWSTRRASARTGHFMCSPFTSWWIHAAFHPFFWLSSFNVALSAVITSLVDALRGNCRILPFLSFEKNVTSSSLNCIVCLLFHFPISAVLFIVYSPILSK